MELIRDPSRFSPFIPRDLQPGEFQLFCGKCGWSPGKNSACRNECAECGQGGLLLATETKPARRNADSE